MIRFAKIDLEIDIVSLQKEVNALTETWKPHFNTRHYEGEWNVLALRAPGGKTDQITPDIIGDENTVYADTPLLDACPSVRRLLNTLNCPVQSVRLLNLKRGANIKPHRDHELAFEKGEARLHFPVFTNEGVEFYIEDTLVPMREGECWYINANLLHSVSNNGATDRIHLIVDCEVNEWLTEVFDRSEKNITVMPDRDQVMKIISELKLQGTESAQKLASELERSLSV
ncbi:MAG TPA: aspartyl/asparaginyl beta-hydroxylase domain-containing protein [Chitinophagaceae bacterium]